MPAPPHRPVARPAAWARPAALALALPVLVSALAACGKSGTGAAAVTARRLTPTPATQGAVSVTTRNTTRLGGADTAADAAAVARTAYPGLTSATRPTVAVLVDEHSWLAALAASVLASSPVGAPILFSSGSKLPAVSEAALTAMRPRGAPALDGAQVIGLGSSPAPPSGYAGYRLHARAAAAVAAGIESLLVTLDGGAVPSQAIVLSEDASAAMAMPAAGLAAESGAPILYVSPAGVPPATVAALTRMHHPSVYVIDAGAIDGPTLHALRHLATVRVIPSGVPAGGSLAEAAVQNAIEVARYTNGTFGWGVKEPGHGLVFANVSRPLDAPASALLAASGDYAPLLLLSSAAHIPASLTSYLSDIQPAYSDPQFPAVRGAYNHGWLIGDETAISAVAQAELDSMLEIVPRAQSSEEAEAQVVE